MHVQAKITGIFFRALDFLRLLPKRVKWLCLHLMHPPLTRADLPWWLGELILSLLEIGGIGEVYETLWDILKFNTRPLTATEKALARSVFGDSLPLDRLRVDGRTVTGLREPYLAWVSFCTVNHWSPLDHSHFIHELVHVWQYKQVGAVYMLRALRAQTTPEGYDYGGVPALRRAMTEGRNLLSFNYEQQGDIVADYYRIRRGGWPHWGEGTVADLAVYEFFVREVRE